jgi:pimeloyl-ACP methyl ester carboxylesterase
MVRYRTTTVDGLRIFYPDYPGFGRSDAPPPARFAYTFQHLAEVMDHFLAQENVRRYSLYLQDYGGPIGFRLALAHPERVQALVIQNAVAHEQGLSLLDAGHFALDEAAPQIADLIRSFFERRLARP